MTVPTECNGSKYADCKISSEQITIVSDTGERRRAGTMTFTVESVPSLGAAEHRLIAVVAAAQPNTLERLNIVVGSNLQRLYYRRLLAHSAGVSANLRFFTPVDLAIAIRGPAPTQPRQPLPDGADALLLDGIMQDARSGGTLRRLDPTVQGVADAVSSTLTDLREATVSAEDLAAALQREDEAKLHDLSAIYHEFEHQIGSYLDRTSLYEDALDSLVPNSGVRDALGGSPLIIVGLYDAPSVQLRLFQLCAQSIDVRAIVVAPPDPNFEFARRFVGELVELGAEHLPSTDDTGETGPELERLYFSAPSRQAEAEEIVRRVLTLAGERNIAFNDMAILHRLDSSADDLIAAALDRAEVPVYRSAGRSIRHTAHGRAALAMLELLLHDPKRHEIMEFLASPALAPRIPPDLRPMSALWERHSKQAGMVQGWERSIAQLSDHVKQLRRRDRSTHEVSTAEDFRNVLQHLQRASNEVESLHSWDGYVRWYIALLDTYFAPTTTGPNVLSLIRDRIQALSQLDTVGTAVDPQRFHAAASRAIRRAVINDRGALTNGIFLGNVSTGRSLRFRAIFVAECAERIFPPLIRQDPLLLDGERERINHRLQHSALPLKRDRQQEERMLFRLVEQSATDYLSVSWARRTNSTGAPKLPSALLLGSIPRMGDELGRVDALEAEGAIVRLPARLAGAAPSPTAIAAGDWDSAVHALDASDFRLALLEATVSNAPRSVLSHLWDGYSRYDVARQGRNGERFSAWDGVLPADAITHDPLDSTLSPTALETYASCPYRYFLRHVLRVGAVTEPGTALVMSPLDRGSMVHRILERWVQESLDDDREWAEFLQDNDRLEAIAEIEFDRDHRGGLSGLPAAWSIVQAEIRADLRELVRIERQRAAQGYRPRAAELEIEDLPIRIGNGTTLRFRGRIDRVDEGPDGLIAVDYKTGRAGREADEYRSGAALQLPVYLQGVAKHYGVEPASVSAEYWYASRRGTFARSTIRGADVLTDPELEDAFRTITDGIQAGRFFPYPGERRGERRRPNCTYCDYFAVCSTDVDARFEHKKRNDQAVVREFLSMQARGS